VSVDVEHPDGLPGSVEVHADDRPEPQIGRAVSVLGPPIDHGLFVHDHDLAGGERFVARPGLDAVLKDLDLDVTSADAEAYASPCDPAKHDLGPLRTGDRRRVLACRASRCLVRSIRTGLC
jgi:hypothetical protein